MKLSAQEQKSIIAHKAGSSKLSDELVKNLFAFLKEKVPDLRNSRISAKADMLDWVENFISLTPKAELQTILSEEMTVDELEKAKGLLEEANVSFNVDEDVDVITVDSIDEVKEALGEQYELVEEAEGFYEFKDLESEKTVIFTEAKEEEDPVDDDDDKDDDDSDDGEEDDGEDEEAKEEGKKKIKESLGEIFGEEMSEEFTEKLSTLFTALVTAEKSSIAEEAAQAAAELIEEKEEEAVSAAAEIIEEKEAQLVEALDSYASAAAEKYLAENVETVSNQLQANISADFMSRLKDLFEEFYVEVPDSKVDVVEGVMAENEQLTEDLNELSNKISELTEETKGLRKELALVELGEGLSVAQQEQLKTLVEDIEYGEDFASQVEVIKKAHFNSKGSDSNDSAPRSTSNVDPFVASTLASLGKK